MKHPQKWRDTIDPFKLPYTQFEIKEILGYPHAGNDVFHVAGFYQQQEVEAFVKVARQHGADIRREIDAISALDWDVIPNIIDHDERNELFIVTLAKSGERLSSILGNNENLDSLDYLYEYGQTLALLHNTNGCFPTVKDRSFFHIPPMDQLKKQGLQFVYEYLKMNRPQTINTCFCHGDFHYANILWKDKHISAILDFELSGLGSKEFDIAWAIILRPGQRFLNTEEEIAVFLDGYRSEGTFNPDYLKYYVVLIYSHFYNLGEDCVGYQNYVLRVLKTLCR